MYPISNATLFVLIFNVLGSAAIPILLFIIFKRRFGGSARSFFYGAATFIVFALVLEQAVHLLVFRSAIGTTIMQNSWLFALYGGMMAGVFEESGRLVVFSTLLKRRMDNDGDALMFGAGHGGIEVIIVFTIAMVTNLVYAISLVLGKGPFMLAGLEAERLAFTQAIFTTLSTTAPPLYLVGLVERIIAVILHLCFSVLVWISVKGAKRQLFWIALFLHAAVDVVAVLMSRTGVSILLIETVVALFALLSAFLAHRAYRAHRLSTQLETSDAEPE